MIHRELEAVGVVTTNAEDGGVRVESKPSEA